MASRRCISSVLLSALSAVSPQPVRRTPLRTLRNQQAIQARTQHHFTLSRGREYVPTRELRRGRVWWTVLY